VTDPGSRPQIVILANMKRVLLVFVSAFFLNLIWENLHSFLYVSYKGGEITEFILMRASLFDAFVITMLSLPFLHTPFLKGRIGLLFLVGTAVAVVNEWYGLGANRWVYNVYMPIVPFANVGLTPAFQLGTLGVISFKIQERIFFR